MRANYDLEDADKLPRVEINGDQYEVGGHKAMLAMVIGHLRTAFFIVLVVGDSFFQPFGGLNAMPAAVKDAYNTVKENKIQFGFMAFFLGTMLTNSLTQSGAFEIYVNGNLEFSKLQSG